MAKRYPPDGKLFDLQTLFLKYSSTAMNFCDIVCHDPMKLKLILRTVARVPTDNTSFD
jgi:hypothetical protein